MTYGEEEWVFDPEHPASDSAGADKADVGELVDVSQLGNGEVASDE